MNSEPEKSPNPYGGGNEYGPKDKDKDQDKGRDGVQDGPVDDKTQPWIGPPPPPPPRET
jgi:hypothetical protein